MILLIFISNQNKKSKIFVQPKYKYLRWESNPHPTITSDQILSLARLPISPQRHIRCFACCKLLPAQLPVSAYLTALTIIDLYLRLLINSSSIKANT